MIVDKICTSSTSPAHFAPTLPDLDFRGVLAGCFGAVVVTAPVDGTLTQSDPFSNCWGFSEHLVKEFVESPEFAASVNVLPFRRLWYALCCKSSTMHPESSVHNRLTPVPRCVVEIAAALAMHKNLIFSSCRVTGVAGVARVTVEQGGGAENMLCNCSHLVDVENAAAAVEADRVRELDKIGPENFRRINQAVATALYVEETDLHLHAPS